MKPKSPQSIQLYNIMLRLGYPEEFADIQGEESEHRFYGDTDDGISVSVFESKTGGRGG